MARQSLLVQQQLVDQLQLPLEHQLELVTHLTAGLLHPPAEAQSHLPTHIHKLQALLYMRSGVLIPVRMRLPFQRSHLKAMAQL